MTGGGAGNRTRVRERDSQGLYMLSLLLCLAAKLPIDRVFAASPKWSLVVRRLRHHLQTSPYSCRLI